MLVLGGCGASTPTTTTPASNINVSQGAGQTSVFRSRVDSTTNKTVLSTTTVTANALFDKDGKILNVQFDSLEISPEPEEGAINPAVFPGWPSATLTNDVVSKDVTNWKTKRDRGDAAYGMNWSVQINFYQEFFKGKTVAEIDQWFAKSASDTNGKILTSKVTSDPDKAKYAKLTDPEKKALVDVTSGASISLKDPHGDFIGALDKAYKNKVDVTLPLK